MTLHYITNRWLSDCDNYTTLHYNTIHYTTLQYTTLHENTIHYSTLHYNTIQYTTLHYNTLQYTTIQADWYRNVITKLHFTTLQTDGYRTVITTLHYTTIQTDGYRTVITPLTPAATDVPSSIYFIQQTEQAHIADRCKDVTLMVRPVIRTIRHTQTSLISTDIW